MTCNRSNESGVTACLRLGDVEIGDPSRVQFQPSMAFDRSSVYAISSAT